MRFLNKLFKRQNNEEISPLKQKIYDEAKQKMRINYLSEKQIEKVIENNEDIDFLDEQIKAEMDIPDIDFLKDKLLPENLKENQKKGIFPKEVVKAVCLGDIIGSSYEFKEHDYSISKTELLPPPNSCFTDDTVLSIATMNAVLENKNNPDFRKYYIDAYHKYPDAGYGGAFISWASGNDMDNTVGYHSMGNGCAMRISFIASYYEDIKDVIKYTIRSCMTTHDHTESIKGSVITAVCIWMALHNYTKEDIYTYCKRHYEFNAEDKEKLIYGWCQFDLNKELSLLSNGQSKNTLFVNNAVPYAIKCFYKTHSYEECMREVLSHFGDTDTVCAIAGGLCYAFYDETGFDTDTVLQNNQVAI